MHATLEPCRTVHIPKELLKRLSPEAKRRGMCAETLVYLLVEKIAEDGLVEAVLDDGEPA